MAPPLHCPSMALSAVLMVVVSVLAAPASCWKMRMTFDCRGGRQFCGMEQNCLNLKNIVIISSKFNLVPQNRAPASISVA